MSGMSEYDPITDAPEPITDNIADQQELSILHMINADPLRTPSFVLFGNDDFFFDDGFEDPCPVTGEDPGCALQNHGFAWNHGDDQPSIASTWQGWVGPGIQNYGTDATTWTDHTDAQPTVLALTGLSDDYTPTAPRSHRSSRRPTSRRRSPPIRRTTSGWRAPTSSSTARSASSRSTR